MLPNWKDESQYPAKLGNDGWAWEFLRRNDEYRAKWETLLEIEEGLVEKYGPTQSWTKKVYDQKDVWFFHPPIGADETIRAWTTRALKLNSFFLQAAHREGMGFEWHLEQMVDPALPASKANARFIRYRPKIWWHAADISELDFDDDEYPPRYRSGFVEIDLRRDVAAQLQKARAVLEARRTALVNAGKLPKSPAHSPKTKQYTEFLRILDADRFNAKLKKKLTPREIAETIYGKPLHWKNPANSLNNKRQQALALVNKGYLEQLIY